MPYLVTIKVVPASGKQKCIFDKQGNIKCYLKSPAEQNKANVELIKLLAKALDCPQDAITILSGATSRKKTLRINRAITQDEFEQALQLEKQQNLFNK